ncbi:MAG: hypothetical protein Q8R28_12025 [Dehalococcoidia bacterium]|nr:hypothetical protein [Dehalococcoidia bacterium]
MSVLLESNLEWSGEPRMNTETLAVQVRQIQMIIREIRQGTDSPGLQSCMHDMEVFCHMALNYLAETDCIVSEI